MTQINNSILCTTSHGTKYYRISGLENIEPVLRMSHTAHCFKAYEVNPMYGCDHNCVYCSIQASMDEWNPVYKVYDDFPTHLENFIKEQKDPKNLTFAFTMRADAFSPVMLESGMTEKIISVFEKYQTRYFIFTKGGHGGELPQNIWDMLVSASKRCHIVMSMGLPNAEFEKILEPGAAPSHERLELIRKCNSVGISTSGSVAPFLPIYEDTKSYARNVFKRYKEAGVTHVSIELLKVTKAGLENVKKYIPEYADKIDEVFDWKHKMEVEWKLPGGITVERFFTNKEYLASQLDMAQEVADELGMSLSVCVEVAKLANRPNINKKAAKCGYSCAGVTLQIIKKQKSN